MGDEGPPALEPAEREEDEATVTEEDEKGSEGELTEDEPLAKKLKVVEEPHRKKIRKPPGETKKALKKEKWQLWSAVKSKYVPDPVANSAQFAELGWKKRAEYIEQLRSAYQRINQGHHVRRLPLLDLRNYWLYLENERFDTITGGKKSHATAEEHEKENDQENEDEKGNSNNNCNSGHRRKKSPKKGQWTNVDSDELFMVGNRISFVPSSATLRPAIQQRRQDGKYLLVDLDHDFEEWVDLTTRHVIEYTEIVWAKIKGHSWWPAQVLREVKMGQPCKRVGTLMIEFCETNEVNSARYAYVRPFEGCLLEELKDKKKVSGLDEAMKIATKLWNEHSNNVANFEHKRKRNIMQAARDNASPASLLQTKIKVYWPLDHQWYVGTVKQYHLQTQKHFILYEDGQKEWLCLAEEMHQAVEDQGEEGGASDYSKIVLDPAVDEDSSVKYNQKCWECGHSGTRVAGWEVDPQDEMTSCLRCGAVCHIRCFHLSRSNLLKTAPATIATAASCTATTSTTISTTPTTVPPTIAVTNGPPSAPLDADADPTKARCRQCVGCETCGEEKAPEKLLTCGVCHFRVHFDCLDPKLSAMPHLNLERGGWVCDFCVKCRSCKANSPTGETLDRKISLLEEKKVVVAEEELTTKQEVLEDKRGEDEGKNNENKQEEKGNTPDSTTPDVPQGEVEIASQKGKKRGRVASKSAIGKRKAKAKKGDTPIVKTEEDEGKDTPSWAYDYTACGPCGRGYVKGNFCPLCFVVWFEGESHAPMICCDACGRWVHVGCDGMTEAVLQVLEQSHRIYHCPECVHRDKLSDLGGLLDHLAGLDTNNLFCFPVSEADVPGYLEIIKSPMDFSTIQSRLRACTYTSSEDFRYDLNLVWRNAKDYNRPNTGAYKSATRLATVAAKFMDTLSVKWAKTHRELRSLEDGSDDTEDDETPEAEGKESALVQSWIPYYNYFTRSQEVAEADTCLACGSLGDSDYMLFCADCGEATHSWCVYALLEITAERRVSNWRCPNCVTCGKCNKCDVDDTLLVCDICDSGRHLQCATPALTNVPNGKFKCDVCVKCRCCGSNKPGKNKKDQWMYNFTMCHPCGLRYAKRKFCAVCDKVWLDSEEDMVECDRCSLWVHSKCDDIDAERYAELNGQAVYHCPACRRQNAKKVEPLPPQGTLTPWELRSLIARIQFRRRRLRRRLLVNARRKARVEKIVAQLDPQDQQYVRINTPFELWTDLPDVHSKLKRMMDDVFLPHGPCLNADALPLSKILLQQRVRQIELERAAMPPPPKPPEKPVLIPEEVYPRKCAPFVPSVRLERKVSTLTRVCKFCGRADEESVEGRLLPYEDMWVHVNCCLWAVECNETKYGEIVNVDRALHKATTCAQCQSGGARIKCKEKQCTNCYHFRCAIQAGFIFQTDFHAFCPAHAESVMAEKKISSPYQLRKLICVFSKSQAPFYHKWTGNAEDRDVDVRLAEKLHPKPKRKRKRPDEDLKLNEEVEIPEPFIFKMGALTVLQLGKIQSRFHSVSHLHPIGFTSKRIYWSYVAPQTRVVYTCRILLPLPSSSSTIASASCSSTSSTSSSTSLSFPEPSSCSSESPSSLASSTFATSDSQNPPPPQPSHSDAAIAAATAAAMSSLLPPERWDPSLPIFEIVAEDDPLCPIRSQSATRAWVSLLRKCGNVERYNLRSKNASGDTNSFGLSGPHFFGFGHPVIVQMLERLPQASKCGNYVFVHKEKKIIRNQAGDSEDDDGADSEGEESEDLPLPMNWSGCARTEGYDVYKTRDRSTILAKKAIIVRHPVTSPTDASQAVTKDRKKNTSTIALGDERDKPISTQYHIMKHRKGRTYVGQSSIHEWGLFSGEHLEPHTMVIEYLGELVRQKVADVREKRYEASGEGSCYMFRIDKDSIVDGTKKGNTSRFINHSCDPNCYTKVVLVDGTKKIIVFANRVIEVDDEVTYDYFFAAEDTKNKITCNCGSYNCAGRLN